MNKLRRCFGEIDMTWKKIFFLAILTAVYTALMAILPVFRDTSFQDISVYPEWWLLFAVFIIMNCKSWKEASLKCFIFFLISQPLIYLLQVPFYEGGFGIFRFYKFWFKATIATLPSAIFAFYVKKQNWLSAAFLAVAIGLLSFMTVEYLAMVLDRFPKHILSLVFCIVEAVLLIFVLFEDKTKRIVLLLFFILASVGFSYYKGIRFTNDVQRIDLGEGEWTYTLEGDDIADISIEGSELVITAKGNGDLFIYLVNEKGEKISYEITVSSRKIFYTTYEENE